MDKCELYLVECLRCGEADKNKLIEPHICKKCRKELQKDFEKAEKARGASR